ncbi:MAG: glycogen debranching protein GlgX [Haliscomenobacter sp.]|nr:glycogen debranching protein GlgX [Haliscomenobacter sp.]MBK9489695.1 glycogen debranching protein GlgX [Haliscomenobacter sp.]
MQVLPGKSYPLGATVYPDGVNFSLYAPNATEVELLLFDQHDHHRPKHVITLSAKTHQTFYYWHCFVPGLEHGQAYAYRVHGPYIPDAGIRFDGQKVLLDPYALAVVTDTWDREKARHAGDNCATALKGIVVDPYLYDWEDDASPNHAFERTIIYELHVGGFTKDPSSGLPEEMRGTYRGLIEKIPYLKSLGITAVELLPIQQFDPYDAPQGRLNYWGYSPISFFAPHNGYAINQDPLEALDEFRDMVKALHKAGIEVILDVVFNHTAEGDENGPTFSWKGMANRTYYMLSEDKRHYKNFSGTGNTLNANHSVIRRMIRHCLRYWAGVMHIDGFRFDLASVLSRDSDGRPMTNPPLLWEIESDPVLASSKLIAEAWDVELYQVGNFIGDRWAEWNGKFRDQLRSFIKGDSGYAESMMQCLLASPDLFRTAERNPNRSINFATCHDGFTLNDLVSYNHKHNLANGEGNRDGHNDNRSWNCGVEGPTQDPEIDALRLQQIKNCFAILLLAQGTPMILMGDEVRRTQGGNNNAYCQDNPTSWFDWTQVDKETDLLRFVREMIRINMTSPYFQEAHFLNSHHTTVNWHGIRPGEPDWGDDSRSLAFSLYNPAYAEEIYVVMNTFWESLEFELPTPLGHEAAVWHRLLDTALASPYDITSVTPDEHLVSNLYTVAPRSVVMLIAKSTVEQPWMSTREMSYDRLVRDE